MSSIQEILVGYDGLRPDQEAFYKDLHQHPELSHQEQRTAERVAGQLQQYGCTVQAGIGGTGVVGILSNGDGPTVLLRADMDALPVKRTLARIMRAPRPPATLTAMRFRWPTPAATTSMWPACLA